MITGEDKNHKCRILIDAMGGDFAPANQVLGTCEALRENPELDLYLVGRKDDVINALADNSCEFDQKKIINADQVIEMDDHPVQAIKSKPDSSMVVASRLVKEGKAEAFVSAGNTGAMMTVSTLIMGRIPGVGRPTIGTFLPSEKGLVTLFDCGASVDCKPQHLQQYAVLASIFVREILGKKNPTVALLNVGSEETKGNELTLAAYRLLKETDLNFIGNLEGGDVFKGNADIFICDGFVGNMLLKFAESTIGLLKTKLKNYAKEGIANSVRALVVKSTLKSVLKDMDSQTYGGVPLLGVNGISIIGHGASSPLAVKNMILRAQEMYNKNLLQKFRESLNSYGKK